MLLRENGCSKALQNELKIELLVPKGVDLHDFGRLCVGSNFQSFSAKMKRSEHQKQFQNRSKSEGNRGFKGSGHKASGPRLPRDAQGKLFCAIWVILVQFWVRVQLGGHPKIALFGTKST